MEYEGTVEDDARGIGGALDEVVVVGVDACDEPLPGLAAERAHECSLLAPFEHVLPGGQHDLEVIAVGLKLTEDAAPEEYVVVALDIGNDFLALLPGVEAVGGTEVVRREVVS